MSSSPHLRGIALAGALAALALVLGLVTLAMNQTASHATPPHTILPLKDRHPAAGKASVVSSKTVAAKAVVKPKPKPKPDPNFTAAKAAGLPSSIAHALAKAPVTVVELTSAVDPVAKLAATEAQDGASNAGAAYVAVDVDRNGGDAGALTRLIGQLPDAPASLVYVRPATLYVTLPGFNDRTTVEQAADSAAMTVGAQLTLSADWATKANSLCRQTYAQLSAITGPNDAKGLAAQKARSETITRSFLTRFKALKPEAGSQAQVARLNTLLAQNAAQVEAFIGAAIKKDSSAAFGALLSEAQIGPQVNSLERQLGATDCAELAP